MRKFKYTAALYIFIIWRYDNGNEEVNSGHVHNEDYNDNNNLSGKVTTLWNRARTSFCSSNHVLMSFIHLFFFAFFFWSSQDQNNLYCSLSFFFFFWFSVQASGVVLRPGQTFSTWGQKRKMENIWVNTQRKWCHHVWVTMDPSQRSHGMNWTQRGKIYFLISSMLTPTRKHDQIEIRKDRTLCMRKPTHRDLQYDRRAFHSDLVCGISISIKTNLYGFHITPVVNHVLCKAVLVLDGVPITNRDGF